MLRELCTNRLKRGQKKAKRTNTGSLLLLGTGEWKKCARQRQRDLSETSLEDLPLVHKFLLQEAVLKVFVGGVTVLSTRTGFPHPLLCL